MKVLNYQGKLINPLDISLIDLENIGMQSAVTLSRINRFWGQTREPYSVAQHCLSMVEEGEKRRLDANLIKLFLIHETYEALTGMDIPTPIKRSSAMREYVLQEEKTLNLMAIKYNLSYNKKVIEILARYDRGALILEAEALMPYNEKVNWREIYTGIEPFGKLYKIGASEKEIKKDFIAKWYELFETLS